MSSITSSRGMNPFLPIVMFMLVLATVAAGVILGSHACKHTLADSIRNCPDDKIGMVLLNPLTGRKATVCEYEPNQWGRFITEEEGDKTYEVTAFANSKRPALNSFRSVVCNLNKAGYTRIVFVKSEMSELLLQALCATP